MNNKAKYMLFNKISPLFMGIDNQNIKNMNIFYEHIFFFIDNDSEKIWHQRKMIMK